MDQPHAVPAPPPGSTTALDCADQARRDGWHLTDGIWQRDDRADAYDDGDWVYLSGGGVGGRVHRLAPSERTTRGADPVRPLQAESCGDR